jgi:hypothetical protein
LPPGSRFPLPKSRFTAQELVEAVHDLLRDPHDRIRFSRVGRSTSSLQSTAPTTKSVAGVEVDRRARRGYGRLKRLGVPRPGFRWSTHLKSVVGTDRCYPYTHVGFLARGHIGWIYPDGWHVRGDQAPQFAVFEAGLCLRTRG